jgi:phage shock protein PspC (stress-responsive transcriptional regulator)
MNRMRYFIEWKLFGVCTAIGERIGISETRIRTWFVYISFLTMGSPLIVYFILAFWMNMKRYINAVRRNPLWNE